MHTRGVPREQSILLPDRLDNFVDPDNPVRVVEAWVSSFRDQEWIEMGFAKAATAATGRPPYHPADLVALILWGYLNGVVSSRKLAKACEVNLEVIWLLGKLRIRPWTISEFHRNNTEAIGALLEQFNLWCKGEGLFGGELLAADGSKFRAVNAKDRNFTRQKAKRRLEEIDRSISRYLEALEQNDREDEMEPAAPPVNTDALKEKIERLRKRSSEIVAMVKEMDDSGQDQVSLTDPESRSMKVKGSFDVCYNAQIGVDSKHGMIVVAEVTNAPNDLQQLSAVAIEAKNFLEVEKLDVVADSGYSNAGELAKCEAAGIEPYVGKIKNSSNEKKGLFTKYDFIYDPHQNTYRCPANQTLVHTHDENRQGKTLHCYMTPACRSCPIRDRCTSGVQRRIRRCDDEDLISRADRRALARPEVMSRRKELAEHPFGVIKRWINGGYFLRKGLRNVRAEFDLAALAFNLKRVITIFGAAGAVNRLTFSR